MSKKILVFIEQRNSEIKKASFEAVKVATDLAAKQNSEVLAIALGNEINGLEDVGGFGINTVKHYKSVDLELYSSGAYAELIAECALSNDAGTVVFANTSLGKDLAPKIAVKLNAGIVMDSVAIKYENDEIIFSRPVYAGKALVDCKINSENKVFTIRPNVFPLGENNGGKANVDVTELSDVKLSSKVTEVKKSEGKLDVAEADIIVSGGRGLKGPENFHLIEKLADSLNAAVGASRAVVDAGWRPHSEQVGQTGKTVSPTLYVACAISGAIQHLAGMRSSKYIVAINKDKDAPIFQVADYGIVGDVFEVLPALTEEINKLKN
ncbi:MAG: electron transfer flavoprotein subunit alpha/FixB family protein [Melioribacteraceae bacterium]|nr:electron transfer flavoprotein subunit alpha/FixB family protein [Melioribacteraceae bacterium]MCF8265052.1 electron transfer flavoprotein subunit alpha/FixB family protein [Melioribacteraceae bacterium]MCF8412451.1 electron transfer flavoprotein subunit alpha/FixB family protein [Melioribacteraceae bacterium]MCF8432724.1 electron transfer flavoprotein subunit alpha/FixB family protein [Melioribacteraceae bacterium]